MVTTTETPIDLRTIAHALADALTARLKAAYPLPADVVKIARAHEIIFSGKWRKGDHGGWLITSQDGTINEYQVSQAACPCKGMRYSTSPCKHRFAAALADRLSLILANAYCAHHGDAWGIAWSENARWSFLSLEPQAATMVQGLPVWELELHGSVSMGCAEE